MGKRFKKFFHPGKCAREAEQKAADARNITASKARQEQVSAEERQKKAFEAIGIACTEGREKIESWYGSELKQAEEDRAKNQADYQNTLAEFSQAVIQAKADIRVRFEEQQTSLLANRAEDAKKLEECRIKIIDRVTGAKTHYDQNKQTLDSLWEEVRSTLLHQRCQDAYRGLKKPIDKIQKTKNYTILVAYLRHLSRKNHLTNADLERYIGFFEGLYRSGITLNKDDNFYHIDDEINSLFKKIASKDSDWAKSAYDSERSQFKKTYQVSQTFNKDLSQKLETARKDLKIQYDKDRKNLRKEKEHKLTAIQENYVKIQLAIETEIQSYDEKYEDYISGLMKDRDRYFSEIEASEKQAKDQVSEQYEAEVAAIADATRKIMDEINSALSEELKQLKKAKRSAVANIGIAIAAGVGAYVSGGLLAGLGSTLIETVETSLGLTSLGAVSNLVNGKSEVGFKFNLNLGAQGPLQDRNPLRENGDSHRKKQMDDLHLNLKSIRDEFRRFSKDIEQWQSEAEDHLFYSLNRPISLPTDDFSESTTVYFNQKPGDLLNVQLGALNQDGLRIVDWGSGCSIIFDRDLRSIFKRALGVDEPFFNQDWHQSQVFSFDQHAIQAIKNRMVQENRLVFPEEHSLEAVRKKSYLEGVLNYFIPAAEASELTYKTAVRKNERAESNHLVNYLKVGVGLAVGFGQKALNVAMGMLEGGIELLQQSEAIIDDPRLIDAELLDRRAAQRGAFSFALRHPAETGRAIFVNYGNEITEGFRMGSLAYAQGRYFESGRACGESWAEPAIALASTLQVGNFAVKTINQGVKSGSKVVKGFSKTREFRSPILFQYDNASLNMGLPLDRMELQYPIRKIINQAQIGDGVPRPRSIPDSMRMRAELAFQEAGVLDSQGRLTEYALNNKIEIFPGNEFKNPLVIQELTRSGDSINDWSKCRIKSITLSNGQNKEIHFYHNKFTNEINYTVDFKIKDFLKEYSGSSIKNRY